MIVLQSTQSYEPQRFYLQKFNSFFRSFYSSPPETLSFSTFSQISRILSFVTSKLTEDYIIINNLRAYSSSIPDKDECVVLIRSAHSLDNGSALLSCIVRLLTRATLLGVSVCIHGKDFVLNVVLDEPQ